MSLGSLTRDTLTHLDVENNLLAQEIANLDSVTLTVDNHVNGEMGIHVAHLVLEALGNTGDHVVDDRADGADGGNVLASTVVDDEAKLVLTIELDLNVQVTEVLVKLTTGALDVDNARLDVDSNTLRDSKFVVLVNVL